MVGGPTDRASKQDIIFKCSDTNNQAGGRGWGIFKNLLRSQISEIRSEKCKLESVNPIGTELIY